MTRALVTLALLCCGCVPRLGAFCNEDDDCAPELRCTGNANTRGICIYREARLDGRLEDATDFRPDTAVDHDIDIDIDIDGDGDTAMDVTSPDTAEDAAALDVLPDTQEDSPSSDAPLGDATMDSQNDSSND